MLASDRLQTQNTGNYYGSWRWYVLKCSLDFK